MYVCYSEFRPQSLRNAESAGRNSLTPLSTGWLSLRRFSRKLRSRKSFCKELPSGISRKSDKRLSRWYYITHVRTDRRSLHTKCSFSHFVKNACALYVDTATCRCYGKRSYSLNTGHFRRGRGGAIRIYRGWVGPTEGLVAMNNRQVSAALGIANTDSPITQL
jgi:hypothetical protein